VQHLHGCKPFRTDSARRPRRHPRHEVVAREVRASTYLPGPIRLILLVGAARFELATPCARGMGSPCGCINRFNSLEDPLVACGGNQQLQFRLQSDNRQRKLSQQIEVAVEFRVGGLGVAHLFSRHVTVGPPVKACDENQLPSMGSPIHADHLLRCETAADTAGARLCLPSQDRVNSYPKAVTKLPVCIPLEIPLPTDCNETDKKLESCPSKECI
jgi:hypothetical protein